MPLADATAISYTAPTIVMVLAFLFLGERRRRLVQVAQPPAPD